MGFLGGFGWIAVGCLAASLTAVFITARLSWLSRENHRHSGLEKRLRGLEMELLGMTDQLDSLAILAKKKYSRDAVRETRRKKAEGNSLAESDDEWKARMARESVIKRN